MKCPIVGAQKIHNDMIRFIGWIPLIGIIFGAKQRGTPGVTRMLWCFWHALWICAIVIFLKEVVHVKPFIK
jgi:hypothetical protein